ncbi:hypothetical protein JTB14_002205 [Gonioctena quinquepunctata]|nr:hypothetical protein JTB14_002205 [Gonioctena quinquepunctata]
MMTIPHSKIYEPSSFLGQPFTLRELELAIKKSSDTAPGFDDITYSMISHLPVVAKIYLLNIFNDIWVRNADCQYWKTVNVIPILKMDKCPNSASSYRPISLFSCLFKTFERMIKARLEWHLKMFNILPTYQFGFKTGYGTLDAVATLVTNIQASLTKNNYCGAVFMDIKGAYDSVELEILGRKLINLQIPPRIAHIIVNLYSNRYICLKTSNNNQI